MAVIQSEIEFLWNEIRRRGFMSALQIREEINNRGFTSDKDEVLSLLECEEIKLINYTNEYLKGLVLRKLYYYRFKEENNVQ